MPLRHPDQQSQPHAQTREHTHTHTHTHTRTHLQARRHQPLVPGHTRHTPTGAGSLFIPPPPRLGAQSTAAGSPCVRLCVVAAVNACTRATHHHTCARCNRRQASTHAQHAREDEAPSAPAARDPTRTPTKAAQGPAAAAAAGGFGVRVHARKLPRVHRQRALLPDELSSRRRTAFSASFLLA
jgi:hypothetical protein